MINAAICNDKDDGKLLESQLKEETAFGTDEQINIRYAVTTGEIERLIKEQDVEDIICVDVTLNNGIENAELFRKGYPKAAIVIIADLNILPIKYMTPSIMAAALLLKPLTLPCVKEVVKQVFDSFVNHCREEEVFVIETKEEKYRIPYSKIMYFEASAKKIYACTEVNEYGFYGTMDNLETMLSEKFVRCHRGYMINRNYIKKVMLSKNIVMMKGNIEIPLSRSYKEILKGME